MSARDLNLRGLVEGAELVGLPVRRAVREYGEEADLGADVSVVEKRRGRDGAAEGLGVGHAGGDGADDVDVVPDAPEDVGAVERSREAVLKGARKVAVAETRSAEDVAVLEVEVRAEVVLRGEEAGEAERGEGRTERVALQAIYVRIERRKREPRKGNRRKSEN